MICKSAGVRKLYKIILIIQIGIIEKAIWPSDIGKPYDGLANDIIILKLKSPLKFNSKVQPACLPSDDWEPEFDEKMRERCFVSGWGDQADRKKIKAD